MVEKLKHHQGCRVVHGGVHCGVIETLTTVGTALVAQGRVRLLCVDENQALG